MQTGTSDSTANLKDPKSLREVFNKSSIRQAVTFKMRSYGQSNDDLYIRNEGI